MEKVQPNTPRGQLQTGGGVFQPKNSANDCACASSPFYRQKGRTQQVKQAEGPLPTGEGATFRQTSAGGGTQWLGEGPTWGVVDIGLFLILCAMIYFAGNMQKQVAPFLSSSSELVGKNHKSFFSILEYFY